MPGDDGVIRIGTVVDISDMRAQMRAAQAAVKSATDNMAAAQVEFGKAAAQGSEQAAAALKGYETELRSAQSTLSSFGAAQNRVAASTRNVTGNFYAAQGASALLEGRIPIRAMERFLASSKLVSGALQVAFPVIGAIAIGEVLAQMAKRVYEAYQNYISLDSAAEQFNQTVEKLRDKDFINVRSIEDADVRIKQADQSAEHLLSSAQQIHDLGLKELFGGNLGTGLGLLIGARKEAGEGYGKKTQANEIDLKSLELNHQIADAKIEAAHAGDAALQGQARINAELQKHLAMIKEEQEYNVNRDRALGNPVSAQSGSQLANLQAQGAHAQAAAQGLELVRQNTEKATRANEELVSSVRHSTEEVQNQAREISDQQIEIYGALQKEADLSSNTSAMDALKESSKEQVENIEDLTQTGERWKEYNDEVAKAAEIQSQTTASTAEATIAYREATGDITKLGAEHQIAAIHAAEYAAKLREIDEQIKKINADSNLTPAQKATETAGLQNQQSQIQGQQQTSAIQSQTQLAQQAAQPWLTAANQISDAWIQGFNKIIIGGRDSWQAMRKASEQMVMSLIGDAEKYVQKKIETYAMDKIFHATTEAAKVATTATANATTMATTSATNVALALSYAAVAAAGASAATAMIPFVGPILAPAAAASTYADTAAYAAMASFDIGTSYIPRDGTAMLHKGEAVLPPPQTEALRDALSGRGGQNGNTNIHYAPVFQSGGTTRDARTTVGHLHRLLRNANATT